MNYMDPSPPTWRLCHPVNIYVFKNGIATEKPQLVHIPMDKKKNMKTVLEEIASRMKLQVGYPVALYDMDGARICQTYELEMYHYYVVVTNIDRKFKCADYGRVRGPLVVIGHHSKHVNTLKTQNRRYDLFCRSKFKRRLHEMMPHGERNGLGPTELPPTGPPCGTLCTKIRPMMNVQPTQVCSDEIMCVGTGRTPRTERGVGVHEPLPAFCRGMPKRKSSREREECGKGSNGQLMNLITRYQHVGSEIFKMFQDRISDDYGNGTKTDDKWGLPSTANDGDDSLQKVQQELMKLAQASCRLNIESLVGQGCPVGIKSDAVTAVLSSMMADNCEVNGGHQCESMTAGQSMHSKHNVLDGGQQSQAFTAERSMHSANTAHNGGHESHAPTAEGSMHSANTTHNGGHESHAPTAERSMHSEKTVFNGRPESHALPAGHQSIYSDNNAFNVESESHTFTAERSMHSENTARNGRRESRTLPAEPSMYSDNTAFNGRRESRTLPAEPSMHSDNTAFHGRRESRTLPPEPSMHSDNTAFHGRRESRTLPPEPSMHSDKTGFNGRRESQQSLAAGQSMHSVNTAHNGRRTSQALTAGQSVITHNYELNEEESEEVSRQESHM